jgi:uncharacterized protein (TIGR02266 family)
LAVEQSTKLVGRSKELATERQTRRHCVIVDTANNSLVRTLLATASFRDRSIACTVVRTLDEAQPLLATEDAVMVVIDPRACADPRATCVDLKGRRSAAGFPVVLLIDHDTNAEVIESAYVGGADDCIRRPLRVADIEARFLALGGPDRQSATPLHKGKRIMLVGGQRSLVRRLSSYLELSGYEVRTTSAAFTSFERLLKAESPEMVLFCNTEEGAIDWSAVSDPTLKAPMLVRLEQESVVALPSGWSAGAWFKAPVQLEEVVRKVNEHWKSGAAGLRVHERVPFFCPVEISGCSQPAFSCFSYDLSPGGLFVKTLVPLAPGEPVALKIHLSTTREEIATQGVVAWANPYQQRRIWSYPVGAGIRFSGPGSKRLDQLKSICAEVAQDTETGT